MERTKTRSRLVGRDDNKEIMKNLVQISGRKTKSGGRK